MRIYLLDVEKLQDEKAGEELSLRARDLIDDYRRSKADRCKSFSSRGSALGVGLVLQLAARGYVEDVSRAAKGIPISLDAEEAVRILERNGEAIKLAYSIENSGKPYLEPGQKIPADALGIPFISISHSGRYVVLALSYYEVGIDIQERKEINTEKISCRFFTEIESALIHRDPDLFFTFWARKEAWGKCEGGGLVPALQRDFSDISKGLSRYYIWSENNSPEGYALCVCEKLS
ncbi:MAG: 4'-phosphopantetheinyl transferase superfamily protein [Lachnospiraceae bacterium]|nr:4'-phosphopantetheinyl transferase superfamily protein [Lachnospiraceae bacterium]